MATGARKADHQICALNFCIRDDARALINGVAKSQGKFCSDFMINAGRHAAEKALLDLTLVRVDQETYAHFLKVVDQPTSDLGFERFVCASKPLQA